MDFIFGSPSSQIWIYFKKCNIVTDKDVDVDDKNYDDVDDDDNDDDDDSDDYDENYDDDDENKDGKSRGQIDQAVQRGEY